MNLKFYLDNWNTCCPPACHGGLGIKKLFLFRRRLDSASMSHVLRFFFNQCLLHYSWDINSANRQTNNVFGVNSNLEIIFFYCFQFSVFSKISGIQTHP